jgi:hypothetical protein
MDLSTDLKVIGVAAGTIRRTHKISGGRLESHFLNEVR